MLARIGSFFLRLLIYLLIGGVAGFLLGIGTGAYLGIPFDRGAERVGEITGRMIGLAFFVWIVGEIVRAVKRKKRPSS